MALSIEDYAVIGDTGTAALVGRDGSVDWLCLPRFDSPACFAALLGDPQNGRWLIGPEGPYECSRRYLGNSAVLESTYTTDTGTVRVVDVMPMRDERADIVRRVVGVEGTVRMRHEWVVRFSYGKVRPWVARHDVNGTPVITAIAGPDKLVLRGSRLPQAEDGMHVDSFDVTAGEELTFATTWIRSHHDVPQFLEFDGRIKATIERSEQWAASCEYQGPYREAVVRSLITLRLMTHGGTGGIVAAPTTSLPEQFGGVRNWDYRFCWLRDASLTLEALLGCGYREEARLWRDWLLRAVAGDPDDLQIMYAVDGGRDLPERELEHLPGYEESRPVRIGNGAVNQKQTDVLGEVMIALEMARDLCVPESKDSWALQRALVENLANHWDQPDNGLWEIRGPLRHFTHSRAMLWAALDCAVRAVREDGLPGPADRWEAIRDEIRDEIEAHGFDHERNTYTQYYGGTGVDASLLQLAQVGYLEPDDPRMLGTVAAIEAELLEHGLLMRYRTETGVDGLPSGENPFLACSFWLVEQYARSGRLEDAVELMDRLVSFSNDVGLLSEQYDVPGERQAGNTPQALTHLTLVRAADAIAGAQAPQHG